MVAENLDVAVVSLDVVAARPEENIDRVERLMESVPNQADVVVLPELFTTGFVQDKELLGRIADDAAGGMARQAVSRLAKRYDVAMCGSMAVNGGGKFYNRAFFIEPSGRTVFYDKRHLFCLSSEAEIFSRGRHLMPVVEYKGWKIAMMVCYDLRFPVWSRNRQNAYDMLIVPANWPQAREYAWTHLLIARAIENQAVVVGANRSGSDDYGNYDGLSFIYDAMGRPIGHDIQGAPIVMASLTLADIAKVRRRMPAYASADDFEVRLP